MDEGWIKLHRKMLDWEWSGDYRVFAVFVRLLLEVNYEDKKWKGILIKRGQIVIGVKEFGKSMNLSYSVTRDLLNKLKSTNEIAINSTNKFSIITVNNYNLYQQNNEQTNTRPTNNQRTTDEQLATTKEIKNIRNKEIKNIRNKEIKNNNIFIKPTIEEIKNYCQERGNNINPQYFFDYYESVDWFAGKTKIKNWKLKICTWEQNTNTNTNIKQDFTEIKNKQRRESINEILGNNEKTINANFCLL